MSEGRSLIRLMIPLSLTVMTAFGVLFYGFSVYLTDEAAGAEFSTAVLSIAYGGAILIGGLFAFPVGRFVDRRGVRAIVLVGSVAGWLGLTAFSFANENWQVLLAAWLLIGPATAMTFYEPAFIAVDRWFGARGRPRALAILMVIGGLAGAIFIPGSERLVNALGWRTATKVLGLLLLVAGVSTAIWALPATRMAAPGPDRPARRRFSWLADRRFALFTAALLLTFGSLQAVLFHRVARFEETGFAVATVATWAAVASLLSLPGRSVSPFLGARFPPARVMGAAIAITAVAVALSIQGTESWQLVGHFIIFGAAFGGMIPLRAMVMSAWYSGGRYGEIMGAQWSVVAVIAAVFPAATGVLRDLTNSYTVPMALITFLLLCAALLTVISERARPPAVSSFL